MTDYVNLTELRTLTRQRADQENSQFVTDTELTRYLNNSWGELYNLIIENFNDDYFTTSNTFSLASGTDTYDLPSDFYKSRGVDLVVSSTESVPLRRYNWAQRTRNSVTVYARDYRYRIQKGSIVFTPAPSSNDSIKLWYIPSPKRLLSKTTTAITRGSTTMWTTGSHEFVVGDTITGQGFLATDYNDSAIKMQVKEEQDVTGLMVQKNQLVERIITESQNRDAGEPQVVTDVVSYEQFYYA